MRSVFPKFLLKFVQDQVFHADLQVVFGQDEGTLDRVFQLADVARPVMLPERELHGGIELLERQRVAAAQLGEKVSGQRQHFLGALAQGRQSNGEDRQTVVQI